jgi:phospholipid/cholesterol/gamma-HCH transport system permease protein
MGSATVGADSTMAPGRRWPRPIDALLSGVGRGFFSVAATAGAMGILLWKVVTRLFPPRVDGRELWRNLYKMSVKSLPIVVVTALFTGGITVIQAAPVVERLGAQGLIGWAAGFSVLREISPLLTALMISGRVGANNAAELGTMVVTEQTDALRVLAIDPISFLVLPRFIGIIVTLFTMTLFADILALFGAAYAGEALVGVSPLSFYHGVTSGLLGMGDVGNGLVKATCFGLVIALASCHFGLSTKGGAPGVGKSVNATVVASAAGVFFLDYFVSFLLG